VPNNDLSSILEAAVDSAVRLQISSIDADALINSLSRYYPNGLPWDRETLRAEVAKLVTARGLAVSMGARQDAHSR
jgi:hypothetical protein